MNKVEFKKHLDEATKMLVEFSKQLCYNDFAENYKYLITQGSIMPFHLHVAIPPDHLKVERDGKFDINWQKIRDQKQKPNNILTKLIGRYRGW